MSQETLDATITIAQWLPIIGLRTVALIYAVDDVADTLRNHADIDHIEMLRNEVFAALIRLDEVTPVRAGLDPEFRRGFDRVLAEGV